MNDKDKEAFEKWFLEFPEWRVTMSRQESCSKAWQAACDYKHKELEQKLQGYESDWIKMRDIAEKLQAENAKLKECLSNWLSWEQKQINTHGEYCGEEIKKLISDARKVLKQLDLN